MKNMVKGMAVTAFAALIMNGVTAKAQSIEYADMKTNVTAIEKPVEKIKALEPIKYNYNTEELAHLKLSDETHYGFKVQSAKENLPSTALKTDSKSYTAGKNNKKQATFRKVNNENLVPLLVAAIQEQQKVIEQMQKQIVALTSKK